MTASAVEASRKAKRKGRLRASFWLDAALFLSVGALQTVPFTGLVLHEWLGIALIGMVLAHLLLSWSWIATQSRRFFGMQPLRARINYLVNLLLFATVIAAIFSGILISQKAVPSLSRMEAATHVAWRWDSLHNKLSQYVLMFAGFHLAINWEWVLAAGEKLFRRAQEGAL